MEILHAKLEGLSPGLLMHNPAGMLKQKKRGKLGTKEIPEPEEEAAGGRYLLPNGNLCVPGSAPRASMLGGAVGFLIGKRAAVGILAGAVSITDEIPGIVTMEAGEVAFPLFRNGAPIGGDDYIIDIRRCPIGRGKAIPRARPLIKTPWELEAIYRFNSTFARLEHVRMALEAAGENVGLLDGRPKVRGSPSPGLWFGKFNVVDVWIETI